MYEIRQFIEHCLSNTAWSSAILLVNVSPKWFYRKHPTKAFYVTKVVAVLNRTNKITMSCVGLSRYVSLFSFLHLTISLHFSPRFRLHFLAQTMFVYWYPIVLSSLFSWTSIAFPGTRSKAKNGRCKIAIVSFSFCVLVSPTLVFVPVHCEAFNTIVWYPMVPDVKHNTSSWIKCTAKSLALAG